IRGRGVAVGVPDVPAPAGSAAHPHWVVAGSDGRGRCPYPGLARPGMEVGGMTALTGERVELARPDGTVLWPRPRPAVAARGCLFGWPARAAVVVAVVVGVLGILGAVISFAAVEAAARPSFGALSWSVPVVI